MMINVYFPNGKIDHYTNASGLKVENGLTIFYYQPDAGKRQEPKNKKVTTTLPILVEEEIG